jgi:cation diffusion facilitator family transporter
MSRSTLSQCKGNRNDSEECVICEKKAGWSAVYANLSLALFKAFIGYVSGSKAILGDALFSFKDFIASLVVVIGIKVSGKPADEQHPYGHGKFEYVALFIISVGLIVSTVYLFIHSTIGIWSSFQGGGSSPKLIAFWAAIISVVANYKLAQYLHCVGDKLQSPSMLANARHNHSDAVSSIMVALSVLGARFLGLVFLDPLVALIEAVCLLGMSVDMLKDSLKGLFDSALPSNKVEQIEAIARLVPGVRKVSKVIARQVGQGLSVDMTIKIDHHLSHQEGYLIVMHVKESIQAAVGSHTIINVVFEPYLP